MVGEKAIKDQASGSSSLAKAQVSSSASTAQVQGGDARGDEVGKRRRTERDGGRGQKGKRQGEEG